MIITNVEIFFVCLFFYYNIHFFKYIIKTYLFGVKSIQLIKKIFL